jgi:hypothetical protein
VENTVGEASLGQLGACALVDATWAVVGVDPVSKVQAVLAPELDDAVPGLEGGAAADAHIGAFAQHYRCEEPGDAELLDRIGRQGSGDPLEKLVAVEAVPPRDVLRARLTVLSVLAGLCRSESVFSTLAGRLSRGRQSRARSRGNVRVLVQQRAVAIKPSPARARAVVRARALPNARIVHPGGRRCARAVSRPRAAPSSRLKHGPADADEADPQRPPTRQGSGAFPTCTVVSGMWLRG